MEEKRRSVSFTIDLAPVARGLVREVNTGRRDNRRSSCRDRKTQSRVPRGRAQPRSFGAVSFNKPRDLSEIVGPGAGETTGGVPARYRRECKNTGERVSHPRYPRSFLFRQPPSRELTS